MNLSNTKKESEFCQNGIKKLIDRIEKKRQQHYKFIEGCTEARYHLHKKLNQEKASDLLYLKEALERAHISLNPI